MSLEARRLHAACQPGALRRESKPACAAVSRAGFPEQFTGAHHPPTQPRDVALVDAERRADVLLGGAGPGASKHEHQGMGMGGRQGLAARRPVLGEQTGRADERVKEPSEPLRLAPRRRRRNVRCRVLPGTDHPVPSPVSVVSEADPRRRFSVEWLRPQPYSLVRPHPWDLNRSRPGVRRRLPAGRGGLLGPAGGGLRSPVSFLSLGLRSPVSLFDIRPRRRGVDERARSPRDHGSENAPGTTARPSACAGAAHGVREGRSLNVRRSGRCGMSPAGAATSPCSPTGRQAPVAKHGAPRDAAAHPRVPTTGNSRPSARSHHGLPRTSPGGPRWSRESRTKKPVSAPRVRRPGDLGGHANLEQRNRSPHRGNRSPHRKETGLRTAATLAPHRMNMAVSRTTRRRAGTWWCAT